MPAAKASRPLSILLAEDHDEFRELLARALESQGALVDRVADGRAALARLRESRARPDVLVSDVRMPWKTGVDLLRELRSENIAIPVIFVTGFGQSVDRATIDALGGAVVLEKPFDFDDLLTALHNLPSIARLPCR